MIVNELMVIRKCKDNQYFLSPGETVQYCKVSCVKTMCGEYEVMTVMIMMMIIVMVRCLWITWSRVTPVMPRVGTARRRARAGRASPGWTLSSTSPL